MSGNSKSLSLIHICILVTLVGGIVDQCAELGYKTGANVRVIPLGKDVTSVIHVVSVRCV